MFLVVFLYTILLVPVVNTNAVYSARMLDSVLQDYGFRALVRPRTGIPYNANVPSNFTGIKVAAVRLRSGSMRRRGLPSYKEFHIPIGVFEQPYVERLVLVYHNLANWSNLYYPLPGYIHLTPVLGILSYDASNLSAKNLPELDIRATEKPILVNFSNVIDPVPKGLSPKCVYFNLDGAVEFDNVVNGNSCKTRKQGHFTIVVELSAAPPANATSSSGHRNDGKKWIIFGSVVGGVVGLVFLVLLIACVKKCNEQKKIERMEEEAERGVPLLMTRVGHVKAPVASQIRTRPSLENEYLP